MTSADHAVTQSPLPVLANEAAGAYRRITFGSAAIPAAARPGQFVAVAVGGAGSGMLLRRCFSIHEVNGHAGGSVSIVVADAGPGTRWLTGVRPGDIVDVVGPLGRPFPLPDGPGAAILVAGGYGSAPMMWLATALREKGISVHHILGAARADRLFGVESIAAADDCLVTTDDGSAGRRGRVTDPLPALLARTTASTVYACGPMAMLRAVTDVATRHGAQTYVAVEEAMACGIGVCMTCVLPIVGEDGVTRMSRSCVDGPTFDGAQVRWEAIADGRVSVPADCLGAPGRGGRR